MSEIGNYKKPPSYSIIVLIMFLKRIKIPVIIFSYKAYRKLIMR